MITGRRIRLFTLLGFEVKIDVSWLVIALLVSWSLAGAVFPEYVEDLPRSSYWVMGIIGAIGLFASVIFHELCHSLVARRFGMPMKGITLFIFGGVAEMNEEPPGPRAEFYMAIAGPAASIAAGLVFLAIESLGEGAGLPATALAVIGYLGFINLILAGFNLIPAFPLDGGRVLRAALWHRKKDIHKATSIASRIGSGFGLFLVFAGIFLFLRGVFIGGLWWVFLGLFLRGAARTSLTRLEMRQALRGEPVERFMRADPVTVPSGTSVAELVEDYVYKYHFKIFPVVSGGELEGCVTTREIKDVPRGEWEERTTADIASGCSKDNTIEIGEDAFEALRTMRRTGKSRLMVTDRGKLAGILSLKDMLEFISLKLDLEEESLDIGREPR